MNQPGFIPPPQHVADFLDFVKIIELVQSSPDFKSALNELNQVYSDINDAIKTSSDLRDANELKSKELEEKEAELNAMSDKLQKYSDDVESRHASCLAQEKNLSEREKSLSLNYADFKRAADAFEIDSVAREDNLSKAEASLSEQKAIVDSMKSDYEDRLAKFKALSGA